MFFFQTENISQTRAYSEFSEKDPEEWEMKSERKREGRRRGKK